MEAIKTADATRRRRRWRIITVSVVALAVFTLYDVLTDSLHPHNFHGVYLNFDDCEETLHVRSMYNYDAFIEQYGEPARKEMHYEDDGSIRGFSAFFPGFTMDYVLVNHSIFEDRPATPHWTLLTVTDGNYRFGWKRIGIGSTREDVQFAFRLDKKASLELLAAEGYQADDAYQGERWSWIMFNYDENGCVERMRITSSRFG